MGSKTIIGKRKDTYRDAIKGLKNERDLQNQFRKLNNTIPPRKKRQGLTTEELKAMENVYRETIDKLSQKMGLIEEDFGVDINDVKEMNARRTDYNGKSAEKKRLDLYDYLSKLRKTLSKDLKAINTCIRTDKHPTVNTLYENSRSEKLDIDISKTQKFGGNLSTRFRIKTAGKDGFFTESKKGVPIKKQLQDAITENIETYGGKSVLRTYFSDNIFEMTKLVLSNRDLKRNLLGKSDSMMKTANDATERRKVMDKMVQAIKDMAEPKNKSEDAISAEEAQGYCDILGAINSPEEYMSLVDYMHRVAGISNSAGINSAVGINPASKADKRNSAMTMVADLIGCKNVVANSVNLHVKDPSTGKIVMGTFMENAKGTDLHSTDPKDMEKFNQLTPEKMENSLSLKKDIANLQILDWICGNPDRHMGNMFYKFDEAGNLVGLTGIDNDTSFGSKDHSTHLQGLFLENMSVIPKETADRIAAMDKESLRTMLYGFDLTEKEVNNAIGRFDQLKLKLEADKEYFKDKPAGYIRDGRIKIVSDEELSKISLFGTLCVGSSQKRIDKENGNKAETQGRGTKNMFTSVASLGVNANGIEYSRDNLINSLNKDCSKVIRNNVGFSKMAEAMQAVENVTYKGSQKFRDMIASLNRTNIFIRSQEGVLMNEGADGKITLSTDKIQKLIKQLGESLNDCDTYLATKNEAKIMKKSKTSNAYKRFKQAKDARNSVAETITTLYGMIEKAELANSYLDKIPGMKDIGNNQCKEIADKAKQIKTKHLAEIKKNRELKKKNTAPVVKAH